MATLEGCHEGRAAVCFCVSTLQHCMTTLEGCHEGRAAVCFCVSTLQHCMATLEGCHEGRAAVCFCLSFYFLSFFIYLFKFYSIPNYFFYSIHLFLRSFLSYFFLL